jgi:hypothetical protein
MPVVWPLILVLFFLAAGTTVHISTRRSAELVVYNSIGASTIGLRSGRILHVYSDTLPPGQEVTRHCATLGLKAVHHLITEEPCLVKAGDITVLITPYANVNLLSKHDPDILIFTGSRPSMEQIVQPVEKLDAVVVASGSNTGARLAALIKSMPADTIHYTGRRGAFRLKL